MNLHNLFNPGCWVLIKMEAAVAALLLLVGGMLSPAHAQPPPTGDPDRGNDLEFLVGDPAFEDKDAEPEVAGGTLDYWTEQLGAENRIARLRAVRTLGAFDEAAGEALRKALTDSDAAVRYVAAVHLGRIGGEPLEEAVDELEKRQADEESAAAAMAAAYALCRAGKVEEHLGVLIERLEHPERGMACSAAELLGMLGPAAQGAIEPLEKTYAKHRAGSGAPGADYHLGGAAQNALRKIVPERAASEG